MRGITGAIIVLAGVVVLAFAKWDLGRPSNLPWIGFGLFYTAVGWLMILYRSDVLRKP